MMWLMFYKISSLPGLLFTLLDKHDGTVSMLLPAPDEYFLSGRTRIPSHGTVCQQKWIFGFKIAYLDQFGILATMHNGKKLNQLCAPYRSLTVIFFHIQILDRSPEVIKLYTSSTQLSLKFILLMNVKMPTIIDGFHLKDTSIMTILIFMSSLNFVLS